MKQVHAGSSSVLRQDESDPWDQKEWWHQRDIDDPAYSSRSLNKWKESAQKVFVPPQNGRHFGRARARRRGKIHVTLG